MPLRETALVAIVLTAALTALFRPRFGLYAYIWFAIVQPDIIAFCEGKYPFSLILGASTLLGSLRYLGSIGILFRIPQVWILLLLQIPVGLSTVFTAGPFLSSDRYSLWVRMVVMLLLIPLLIESVDHMKELLVTLAISEGLLGSRFGLFGLMQGGTVLNQPYGHATYDNNVLALAIAMMAGTCWCTTLLVKGRLAKLWLLGIVVTSMPAVIMTNSRGSSLALGVMLLCMILYSKRRMLLLVIAVLALGPVIYLMQDTYFNRMRTIEHYQDEGSAASRVVFWNVAIRMWEDHPAFGVGFGQRNYQRLVPKYLGEQEEHVVHNTYLQMLVDSGIFAFLGYCALLLTNIFWLAASVRHTKKRWPGYEAIPMAIEIPLIGFAVGCMFYSLQICDFPYFFMMAGAAWYRVTKIEEPDPELVEDDDDAEEIPAWAVAG